MPMNRTLRKTAAYLLLIVSVIFLLFVFLPRTYDVPKLQARAGTQFWSLSTGSKIGYTYFKGKGIRKPFPLIFLNGGPGGAITDEAIQCGQNFLNDGFEV